jgi:hypothetical protein
MKFISNRRAVATIVATSCLAIPASASAMPISPPVTTKSGAAQSGSAGSLPATYRSDAAQSGVTTTAPATGSEAVHWGGSLATAAVPAPATIEVVRPERTVVRDVDEMLPLILSSTALLLVLAGFGIVLVRTRMVPRPGASS